MSLRKGRAVLASLFGGSGEPGVSEGGWSPEKKLSVMYKYAVFGIKPTYNDSILISDVQSRSPKISVFLGGGGLAPLPPSL